MKTPRERETALVFAAALLMQDVVHNKALDRPARDKIREAALTLKEMADEIKVKEHAAAALEAAGKAQRWIPVSERLPAASEYRNGDRYKSMDSNELVPLLVCCDDTEIPFRAFYDGKSWGDGWSKQNVTHWQKLPQPPQKGE